jgi:hypothetical protein
MALSLLKNQLPSLIEKFEPEIEKALRDTLRSVKTSNPSESALFYQNWKKLNSAIEEELGSPTAEPVPVMTGGEEPVIPEVNPVPEPSPPIVEPTGPTGPVVPEATGPTFLQETGPTGPTSIIQNITNFFAGSGPTGPTGGKKHRKRKTAKQHKKRTHRVKHRKH